MSILVAPSTYAYVMIRPPWSRRRNDQDIKDFFVLRTGVPDGLLMSLTDFVAPIFYIHDEFSGEFLPNREVINEFARITDRYLPQSPNEAAQQFHQDRGFMLEALDFALGQWAPGSYDADVRIGSLNRQLEEARSAYVVGIDASGRYELQDRQPEELTRLVVEATSSSDRSSEHLRRAWSKAFGRKPDPTAACVEAVAAIEAAAKPAISPKNPNTTLGTLIRDMRAKPSKWTTDSEADDDIEKIISMMEMVWTGHLRHGDDSKPIDVSEEGAEMIVQVSALLVHWFRSGRISHSAR